MRVIARVKWRADYRVRRPYEDHFEDLLVDCLAIVTAGLFVLWLVR